LLFQLELDFNDETLERELTNEEVYDILAAEDRQESIVPGTHPNSAVLQVDPCDKPTETVIYFHEETEAPSTANGDTNDMNEEIVKNSSKDYHQTVFLEDNLAST
jgi:hypothetical protein